MRDSLRWAIYLWKRWLQRALIVQSLMSLQYPGTKVPVSSPDVYYYYYLPTYGNNHKTYFPNQENYHKLLCKIHDSENGIPFKNLWEVLRLCSCFWTGLYIHFVVNLNSLLRLGYYKIGMVILQSFFSISVDKVRLCNFFITRNMVVGSWRGIWIIHHMVKFLLEN